MAQPKAPFPQHYRAESHGAFWHLFCKKCSKAYELRKQDTNPGNQLRLLNHARSHSKKSSKKAN